MLTLTSLIKTRRKLRKSTCCVFIDFKKAYDTIDRNILWKRLSDTGITGKMFGAVKSLYMSVKSCVRFNHLKTDWFDVNCGLRQGCTLSPLLFNIFINDLSMFLKSFVKCFTIGDENICSMLYADGFVISSESAEDLQVVLKVLNGLCSLNKMNINAN